MIPAIPPVTGDTWTFEQCLTAPAIGFNPREAALGFLLNTDWQEVMEYLTEFDDPIEAAGTDSTLDRLIRYGDISGRDCRFNTLHAWLTAHTARQRICNTEGHENAEGVRDFNYCDYSDDGLDCEWSVLWALMGDPVEFLRLAQRVIRGDR